jgi:xanthine dehydrogenase accessory factor
MNDNEIYQKLTELKDQRIVACLATIVETAGSTPREAGAKMIICADGSLYGSVGGGCK